MLLCGVACLCIALCCCVCVLLCDVFVLVVCGAVAWLFASALLICLYMCVYCGMCVIIELLVFCCMC